MSGLILCLPPANEKYYTVSHLLGANLESALQYNNMEIFCCQQYHKHYSSDVVHSLETVSKERDPVI